MWEFVLGFYVAETFQTACLVYIALPQSKPKWSRGQRAAASLVLGLLWWLLVPWIMRQAGRRVAKGH